ncbi:MAG: TM2 domain-containing protein [Idiomarina sp.]|nr:TM2 domain-containing protein [Idiomarina sp.]
MLTKKDVNAEEERLRGLIRQLSDIERKAFYEAVRREVKDPDTYAVLNWFFICGLHHFYLGKWWRGAINLTGFCLAILLMGLGMANIGVVVLVLILTIELGALFRAQIIVQAWNNAIYRHRLAQLGVQVI